MKTQRTDDQGNFKRVESTFRDWITNTPGDKFVAEPNRYHLYVSLACPWAHRTLITRALMGLEEVISVSIVDYHLPETGWFFSTREGTTIDHLHHKTQLSDLYQLADPQFNGRITVPVLWDKKHNTIVNNESREIMRMISTHFTPFATSEIDLCPKTSQGQIDTTITALYETINNGVYKVGFATTQASYDQHISNLYKALETYDTHLQTHDYLVDNTFTEADICLFVTLYRYDPVYVTHFKCSYKRLSDYPGLYAFVNRCLSHDKIKKTCNMTHIRHHYYQSHKTLNPHHIVPLLPFDPNKQGCN